MYGNLSNYFGLSTLFTNYVDFITDKPEVLHKAGLVSVLATSRGLNLIRGQKVKQQLGFLINILKKNSSSHLEFFPGIFYEGVQTVGLTSLSLNWVILHKDVDQIQVQIQINQSGIGLNNKNFSENYVFSQRKLFVVT